MFVHTLVHRLAENNALGHALLAVSALDAHAIDQKTLLRLVPKLASFIWAGRPSAAVDRRQLPVFPSAQAGQETHHIGLLLICELREILVRTHGSSTERSLNMLRPSLFISLAR